MATARMLKLSCTVAAAKARRNSSPLRTWPKLTNVLVNEVPIFAPITIGIAMLKGKPPATIPTIIEVTVLELLFKPLQNTAEFMSGFFISDASVSMSNMNFMKTLLAPADDALKFITGWLPEVWAGIALIVIGIALILFVVSAIGKLLRKVMVGKAKDILHKAVGRGPIAGMTSGSIITVLVQSSSTTTALIVPLAGTGVFSIKQIYPFTLGANVGTTITALLAATAISGPTAELALQIALVHLFFNVMAILLIYVLPVFRQLPIKMAETLAIYAQKNKLYVVAYIGGVFFVIPLLIIGLSQIF